MKRPLIALPVLAAVLLVAFTLAPPRAVAAPADGTVTVRITTPAGVPAAVRLAGLFGGAGRPVRVATKAAAGTTATVRLTAPSGLYMIAPQRVVVDGVAYVGRSDRPATVTIPRIPFTVNVTYAPEDGASGLHATSIAATEVGLEWSGPAGARFVLRRATGTVPPATRIHGTDVRTSGTTARDVGLDPGRRYSYSLFTQYRNKWVGPLTVTAGTTPPPGSTDATYVAPATTLLAEPADVVSAVPTGDGVDVVFRDGVKTLTPGAGVTLPISADLLGGFLGVVERIAIDGRLVTLRAGGLGDAFDFYRIAVDDLAALPGEPTDAPAPLISSEAGPPVEARGQDAGGDRPESAPDSDGSGLATQQEASAAPFAAAAPAARAATCTSQGGGDPTVTFEPEFGMGGYFRTTVDRRFGAPVGASVDMELTATVSGAARVAVEASASCSLNLPKFTRIITTHPVPISVVATPRATIQVSGGVVVDGLGMKATGGARVEATLKLAGGSSIDAEPVLSAGPLTPKVTASGSVDVKVGGDVVVGPGAGTSGGGVVAGVQGDLYALDASFGPYFSAGDSRFDVCLSARARATVGLSLVAKAWLGSKSVEKSLTADALNGSKDYPGSPWAVPTGCDDLPTGGSTPPDSLFGPGVSKVGETTVGGVDQVGYVAGFVPGSKAWVLSTGLISNAVGPPDALASTNLGGAGDPDLSELAGFPTYDAGVYTVTLVPQKPTLNVRYVFASEEYPEYVGSSYNDVMAVRVNGEDCAAVPGTTDPVAINTVNAGSNAAYFVDNAGGAAGYATTMDGLTVPLTCSVPVTPGEQVTVQIAVADTSDGVLDSAVALVDGGIWTS